VAVRLGTLHVLTTNRIPQVIAEQALSMEMSAWLSAQGRHGRLRLVAAAASTARSPSALGVRVRGG
jgi:hypothetical protein